MASVADLHTLAIEMMNGRPPFAKALLPGPTPDPDMTGSTWGMVNGFITVISYAGLADTSRPLRERHQWWVQCVVCGFELRRSTRAITARRSTECPACKASGITERPTVGEAMAAYNARQRLAA